MSVNTFKTNSLNTNKEYIRGDDDTIIKGFSKITFFQKRIIDFIFSLVLLLVTSPIILYTLYRIKKESSGKIFFTQPRVGMDGKLFTCYKFRSMHTDVDFSSKYTEDEDPRVFAYGKIMRKYRIDELPQIFNILKGDMHLVGPRAEWDILVKEYARVIPKYESRHLVRPGITGLAQVYYPYGRNSYDARQKLKYDMIYIKNWSLWLEFKVLIKTVMVVLGKKGI
jgi:lipopolysaccharide/colanic/teichoic acid biosynthesis glycosyltransferase